MDWTRRDFLATTGAAAAAVVALGSAAGCSSDDDDSEARAAGRGDRGGANFDPSDWDSVRDQFPLDRDRRHFAAFVLAAHPRPVAEAIEGYRQQLDADTETALNELGGLEQGVREAAARYLDGAPEEVALTDSTTMGLGLLYGGLRLGPDQEVLTTEHDFYSTYEALRLRSARDGAVVRRVRLYDDPAQASADEIVGRLVEAVTAATRAVAVTWVHSSTGVKLPIRAMADELSALNADRDPADRALLCVDGVHGFGIEDVTAADLGCDFLVSGTHKWLFGPRGTGLIWGRREAWPRVVPVIPAFAQAGFDAWTLGGEPADDTPGQMASPGGFHSFEHRWALIEAFEFHEAIGKAAIQERTQSQASALKEGLAELDGVEVVTPLDPALSAGIVCVDVSGAQPFELVQSLAEQDIVASTTPYNPSYLRFGPSIVTSPDDVDEAVAAVASLV